MKTQAEVKEFYQSLQGSFQGYIQMSDSEKIHIFEAMQALPKWEDIHDGKNFILEACFFDGKNRSIAIRQYNDGFQVVDIDLSSYEHKDSETFLTKEHKTVKIIQIWEATKEPNCQNFEVLKPKFLVFGGFVANEGGKNE